MADPGLVGGELLLLLSTVIGLALHEGGHSLAGEWAGLPARLIALGTGPTLARMRFGRVQLVVHAWPGASFAACLILPGATPRAFAFKTAGGPAANAVLLGLAAAFFALWPGLQEWIIPVLIPQALLLVVTLVPYRVRAKGQLRVSDGMTLVQYARGKLEEPFDQLYRGALAPFYPADAPLPPPSADAPELLFQYKRPDRWVDRWARRDAQEEVALLVEAGRLTVPERVLALTFLINNELSFADTGTTDGWLLHWSAQAILAFPEAATRPPAVLLAHAGVLVRQGDAEAADAMLCALLAKLRRPDSLVTCRLYLAQAAALQGRREDAANHLAEARAAATGPGRKALLLQLRRAACRPPLRPLDPARGAAISPA